MTIGLPLTWPESTHDTGRLAPFRLHFFRANVEDVYVPSVSLGSLFKMGEKSRVLTPSLGELRI
jgi:hypothetical protein